MYLGRAEWEKRKRRGKEGTHRKRAGDSLNSHSKQSLWCAKQAPDQCWKLGVSNIEANMHISATRPYQKEMLAEAEG